MSPAITDDTTPNNTNNPCIKFVVANINVSEKFIALIATYALSRIVHYLLRPLSQPYITSDITIGLVLTSLPRVRDSFTTPFNLAVENAVDFGMICYAFVLGLEMDPYVIFKPPTRQAMVAYAGMLCTFIMASTVTPWLNYLKETRAVSSTLSLSICLSGNGSHILTRLMTKLKVGKSDIGKLSISAGVHSDMITMLLLAIGFVFFPAENIVNIRDEVKMIKMGVALVIQTIVAANVSPIFINWINNENPEGKPLKGSHLVLSMAFMASICSWAPWFGYNSVMSAFMGGLFLPSEGRISKWAISKLNNLLSILFYPLFFFWVGLRLDISRFEAGIVGTWVRLLCLVVIATIGKVGGTLLCGLTLGYHRPEMVAVGLLLTAKGHFHVYLAVDALRRGRIDVTTCTLMIILVFLSVVHTPIVVKHIIERARKRVPIQRMALQWLDPSSELRILLCLHGPHNLDSAISLMEISRGRSDPGLFVHVTDMIELTEQIAAAMAPGEGMDNITITDTSITEMRDQITHAFQTYINENGGSGGIKMSRVLALSTFNSMPQDICALAEDLMVSLILLPFHKRLNENGMLDEGHPGFRYVNRKLLRNAPCSTGILVDRGFCFTSKFPRSSAPKVAVLFIGGKDDREALAFAGRVARHPGVKLTVIRFLVDKNSEHAPRRVNNRVSAADQEEEMKLDDECFAQFYEKHVAGSEVAYMEKHLANSSETYTNLTSLEGQYSLIIVGRGGRANTVLTQGLNDWQQCPELGPVGDVLSGSSSASGTSILIIQLHNIKAQLDGLSEEFSIM